MGRRRTIDDARILATAREQFLRRGNATSTRAIARALGVSEGVLYQRFGSKDELFDAAMTPTLPPMHEVLGPSWELEAVDSPERARAWLMRVVDRLEVLFEALAPLMEQRSAYRRRKADPRADERRIDPRPLALVLQELTWRLGWLSDRGFVATQAPWVMAEVLMAAVSGMGLVTSGLGASHIMLDTGKGRPLAEVLVDQLWWGLRPREGATRIGVGAPPEP